MTITTTLSALVPAEPALARLGELRLPAKASYHLAKLTTLVQAETKVFHAEREKLLRALGVEREATPAERVQFQSPTVVTVPPEKMAEFVEGIEALGAVEVNIEWKPFDLTALGEEKISASDVAALGPLVTYPET